MKTSKIIIYIVVSGVLMSFILMFISAKYINNEQPKQFNCNIIKLPDFSTVVFDQQANYYLKADDSNFLEIKYWGKKKNFSNQFEVKNDTLFLHYQFEKSENSIHLGCKNVNKIIIKNNAIVTISKLNPDTLSILVNHSFLFIKHHTIEVNDTSQNKTLTRIELMNRSTFRTNDSEFQELILNSDKSLADFLNVKLNKTTIRISSGSTLYTRLLHCTGKYSFKSDNTSKYFVNTNKKLKPVEKLSFYFLFLL